MEKTKDFIAPKLSGGRFDDHSIPVNVLEDFAALEELVIEVAKQIFLEENPGRKRVPKGFTDNVSLKINGIGEGSAIPNIILALFVNAPLFNVPDFNPESITYFEKARDRIVQVIENAGQGVSNENLLDQKYLNYFNRIGRNLQEGESIDFVPRPGRSAILNKTIRKKILLSRSENYEYSDSYSFNAWVSAIDFKNNKFTLEIDDTSIPCDLNAAQNFIETIRYSISEYQSKPLLSIKATGIFNRQDKLTGIENIESMDILDPYDVNVRLNYLSKIEDNWYDGQGKAPGPVFLKQFGELFSSFYSPGIPLPAIFPTIEGDIQLEWSLPKGNATLEVSKANFSGELFIFNADDTDEEHTLELRDQFFWTILNEKIRLLNE